MLCFGGQLRNNTINHKHACLKMSLKMSDEEGHVEAPAVVPWSCCWSYELYMLSIIHGCFQEIRFRKVDLKFTIVFFYFIFLSDEFRRTFQTKEDFTASVHLLERIQRHVMNWCKIKECSIVWLSKRWLTNILSPTL